MGFDAGAGVPGGLPTTASAPGAGLLGTGACAGAGGLAGLLKGFAVEGTTRLGFCLSGSTSGPFWPHANSAAVKPMIINKRARFIMLSIPAASLRVRPELLGSPSGPSN